LVHGAVAPCAVTQLLLERHLGEERERPLLALVVERLRDAVPLQDREADLTKRLAELAREERLVGVVSAEETPEVAGPDPELLVERLSVAPLGQVVFLLLLDLVVARVLLVGDLDAEGLPVAHEAR